MRFMCVHESLASATVSAKKTAMPYRLLIKDSFFLNSAPEMTGERGENALANELKIQFLRFKRTDYIIYRFYM